LTGYRLDPTGNSVGHSGWQMAAATIEDRD
jgi:hypothetical protein